MMIEWPRLNNPSSHPKQDPVALFMEFYLYIR